MRFMKMWIDPEKIFTEFRFIEGDKRQNNYRL